MYLSLQTSDWLAGTELQQSCAIMQTDCLYLNTHSLADDCFEINVQPAQNIGCTAWACEYYS